MAAIQTRLAANIRGERAVKKWRQADLAERLGVVQRTVSEMESGQRVIPLGEIVQLCRVFDVPLSVLLRGADQADLDALGL